MNRKKRILNALLALMLAAALVLSPAAAFAEEPEAAAAAEVAVSPEVRTGTEASAPVITGHPSDRTVTAGDRVSFTVNASGEGLTYRWQVNKTGTWNDCTSAGSDRATFTFTAKAGYSGWKYRCVVSNAGGSVISEDAVLTVTGETAPYITEWVGEVECASGRTAVFSVRAIGGGLTYQWQVSKDGGSTWKNCTSTGYDTNELSFTAKLSYNGWMYRCRVKNSAGEAVSEPALLTVTVPAAGPRITKQPGGQKVSSGERAVFTVAAEGAGLTYRWQVSKDGGNTWKNCTSAGSDASEFSFTAKASYDGWKYRCVVTNYLGTAVTSETALLTVETKPVITGQPSDQTVNPGEKAVFEVTAADAAGYQWQYSKNGGSTWTNCTSAGSATAAFRFTATAAMNGRLYRCVVRNSYGSVTSAAVSLIVSNRPVITDQTYAEYVRAGEKAVFSVTASGATGYRWQYSKNGGETWTNCTSTGASTATFRFTATAAMDGRLYRCVVSNAEGSVTSIPSSLTVDATPRITQQPMGAFVTSGTEIVLEVTASGASGYRWQYSKNGGETWTNCTSDGAASPTFRFKATVTMDGRLYRCVVTNAFGSAWSDAVSLRILSPSQVITQEQAYRAIIAMKAEYPEGRHWTNDDFYAWKGFSPDTGCYHFGGYGCVAFAFLLSDAAFGDLPARLLDVDFDNVRAGDVLRVDNDSHSVIVLEKHYDYVVVAEGNFNSSVHWGRTMTASEVNKSDYILTRYPKGS